LKLPTRLFILFQILDLSLTFFAIRWGLAYEANPVGFTPMLVLVKGTSTLLIAHLLDTLDFGWLVWIPVAGMYTVVWWNIAVIIIEFIYKLYL